MRLQNHYPRSTGAPSCRFRTLTRPHPSVDSGLTLTICVKNNGIVGRRLPGFTETRGRPPFPASPAGCIWVGPGRPGAGVSSPLPPCSRTSPLPCRDRRSLVLFSPSMNSSVSDTLNSKNLLAGTMPIRVPVVVVVSSLMFCTASRFTALSTSPGSLRATSRPLSPIVTWARLFFSIFRNSATFLTALGCI